MEYSFWMLETNPVRIVKYRFDPININSILFRTSIYTIFGLISRAKKNVTLVLKLVGNFCTCWYWEGHAEYFNCW